MNREDAPKWVDNLSESLVYDEDYQCMKNLVAAVQELQEEYAAMRRVVDAARGDMGFAESRINLEAALDALDAGEEE